jgi:hydroxyacylglutathione hydrolase
MAGTAVRWKQGLVALVVGGVAVAVFTAPWGRPRPDAGEPQPLAARPMAVVPGVYLLGLSTPSAAYAVETTDGLVLVDSGVEADAATVTRQLWALGLDVRRTRAILLTHAHGDHSLGAARLRERTGAKVYAGRADCRPLRAGGPREAFFSTFDMPHVDAHATPVDVELTGGETIEVGDARLEVIATPGHTPGSVCYLLERGGRRALFTGDVIQSLSPATEGALGTYAAYLAPLYRGSARAYLASLSRLRALPVPDLVLPGHPRMDATPQSPRLSEERWHALLDRGARDMERLLARYEADGEDFLDGSPKELLPGLHYLGDLGGAVYCLKAPRGLFLVDAPGGPSLVAFLDERFKARGWEGAKPTAVLLTSADGAATAGLAALVRRTGCKVVAPGAGLDAVRARCPTGAEVFPAEGLAKRGWFDAEAVPLAGRGVAPVAYRLRWAGKTVLLSGRIPVKVSVAAVEELMRDVMGHGSPPDYLKSLAALRRPGPDLWLPAVPVHGQNANLYDRDWEQTLAKNAELFPR